MLPIDQIVQRNQQEALAYAKVTGTPFVITQQDVGMDISMLPFLRSPIPEEWKRVCGFMASKGHYHFSEENVGRAYAITRVRGDLLDIDEYVRL